MTRIAFCGTSAFAAGCLEGLLADGFEVALVVSQPDRPAGRARRLTPPPVAALARERGLGLVQPEQIADAGPALRAAAPAVIAICAYGGLVPRALLDEFTWLNLHPSLLPRWRGAAPIERAILEGDETSGVCVMELVEELDAGPVAGCTSFRIDDDDDAGTVAARALALGVPLLADALRDAASGTLALHAQPREGTTYAAKLTGQDRALDPASPRAAEARRVRAFAPAPGARLLLGGESVTVWRVRPSERSLAPGAVATIDGELHVGFADGALEILELQAAGRGRVPAAAFLRGARRTLDPAARP